MKLYIAGPMTGHPQANFPAFDYARDFLLSKGYGVISPADHDREIGYDYTKPDAPPIDTFPLGEAILWDLAAIERCDGIYLLKGWETSRGANLELHYANFRRKIVLYEENFECITC